MTKPINSQEDFNELTPETQSKFITVAEAEIAEGLKDKENGAEKLEKLHQRKWLPKDVEVVLGNATKVRNRNVITAKVAEFTEREGRIPSISEVALETGLKYPTVQKHLTEMRQLEHTNEDIDVFNSLRHRFLQVIAAAGLRDPKAAKMALDIISEHNKQTAAPVTQTASTNVINILQMINGLPPVQKELVKKNLLTITSDDTPVKVEVASPVVKESTTETTITEQ
jgi:hypothetical protein